MTFDSILYQRLELRVEEVLEAPAFFADLNLDHVVDLITADFKDYNLKPFYYTRLTDIDTIQYCQEVMEDLDHKAGMQAVRAFSERMRRMRDCLNQSKQCRYYPHTETRLFLGAVDIYRDAVECLNRDLFTFNARSQGICALREYLGKYVDSESFGTLVAETAKLKADLSAIRYSLLMGEGSITVWNYNVAKHFDIAQREIEDEMERRMNVDENNQACDEILRLLVNVRSAALKKVVRGAGTQSRNREAKAKRR